MNEGILSVAELAELLKVPKSWVYERTRTGRIPHYRIGKYVRFDRQQVLDWLDGLRDPRIND